MPNERSQPLEPARNNIPLNSGNGSFSTPQYNTLIDLWDPTENEQVQTNAIFEKLLLKRGLLTKEQILEVSSKCQGKSNKHIAHVFLQTKLLEEVDILSCLSEQYNIPLIRLDKDKVDPKAFKLFEKEFIEKHNVLPVAFEGNKLVLAISDPTNIFFIDELQRRVKIPLLLKLTPSSDIKTVVSSMSEANTDYNIDKIIRNIHEYRIEIVDNTEEEVPYIEQAASESPIIKFVNYIIVRGIKEKASDIHIEPGETKMIIRFRIDGVLFDQITPPQNMHASVISRIKIIANLDIAERRLPQDGRVRVKLDGNHIDLRVSTMPSARGEKVVIRLLDTGQKKLELYDLGMGQETLEELKLQIKNPHGIILVTGPTGSGKSTTLYACLQTMDVQRINISTVEDPVEYQLDRVTQVHVIEKIGLTFAKTLRAMLRQDPDVIMIGEIRDDETARIAIQASLTGHLVLSTLHTNDAPSSITRLINIGVEPYLIAASTNAVLAQRLTRRICPHCKEKYEPAAEHLHLIETYGFDCDQLYKGKGCNICRHTGYQGRLGLYELMLVDDVYKDVIASKPTVTELRRICKERNMITLRDDGFKKVKEGLTTIDEVMRVTDNTT